MLFVDHEIGGNTHGQGHGSHDVLNHPVRSGFVEFSVACKGLNVVFRQAARFGDQFKPFLDGQFVQSFHATVLHRHGAP